ncbi:class I adenylate-forming enzyme family protein [Nocardia nova]|uniref:class I adenylate-forming enzyme family protein n=1 Tax=Nocardia nova TaxID=37330 RepID=UPI0033F44B2C
MDREKIDMVDRTPAQRRAALEARFPEWRPRAIHEWFFRSAAEFADRDFIVTEDRTVTYREMAELVERVAAGLYARGIRKGDHLALLMANFPEYVAVKYAVSRLGAVLVPLNFMFKRDELGFVLRDSDAKGLIVMTGFRGFDYVRMLDDISPGWERRLPSAELPQLRFVVQFDALAPARAGVETFGELIADDHVLPASHEGPGPDDISMMLYTSGSTGQPKGVLWTHDQDARVGFGGALSRAFGDGWRVLTALPLYHAFANNEVLNAAMFAGGAAILRRVFDAAEILDAIDRDRANELVTVPTMVVALCEAAAGRRSPGGSLAGLMAAGAPAPVWLWERAIELLGVTELTTGYGQTESGGGQVMSRPEGGIEHVSSTVGRIKYAGPAGLPELGGLIAEMHAADLVTGEILPEGEEGELISRGPINARGYWKLPDETTTFRDGWVYSGDIGTVTSDGVVTLTGRKKELIRSGGENYAPKEVEELLTGHPAVSQAFVVPVPDARWGEIGCAWLVPEPGATIDVGELDALCRERLAGFKRPRRFRIVTADELPTTPTGKVQKFRLAEWATRSPDRPSPAG